MAKNKKDSEGHDLEREILHVCSRAWIYAKNASHYIISNANHTFNHVFKNAWKSYTSQ